MFTCWRGVLVQNCSGAGQSPISTKRERENQRFVGFTCWRCVLVGSGHGTSEEAVSLSSYCESMLRYMLIPAGPTNTTKMPGKMNRTSGKIIFTAVLAAFSSAI